jgi:hypothetical protein
MIAVQILAARERIERKMRLQGGGRDPAAVRASFFDH